MVRPRPALLAVAFALLLGGPPAGAWAQGPADGPDLDPPSSTRAKPEPAPPPPADSSTRATPGPAAAKSQPAAGIGRQSILALFARANPMLWLLGICSVVTVGYTLERLMGLRRGRVTVRRWSWEHSDLSARPIRMGIGGGEGLLFLLVDVTVQSLTVPRLVRVALRIGG